MNPLLRLCLSRARKLLGGTGRLLGYDKLEAVTRLGSPFTLSATGDDTQDVLRARIVQGDPFLFGRLGWNELTTVVKYLYIEQARRAPLATAARYVLGLGRSFWWEDINREPMRDGAGFFPVTDEALERFARLTLDLVPEIDVQGSWLTDETYLDEYYRSPPPERIAIHELPAFAVARPWTAALEGSKVLVIHPFRQSIESQYARRERLFTNPEVLPPFDLQVMAPVQSIAGCDTDHATWFDALDAMKAEMDSRDYDVALVAAGAYGIHLAAHAKRRGKMGIHVGGDLQIYFGIMGQRWETNPRVSPLVNEYWIRPSQEETPRHHTLAEGGCYW